MEQKSSMRDFARYTILSVLGTLGVSCYILADTFFVSKGVGTDGLAALNLAIPVYNFIHGTGLMLGMGGAIKIISLQKSRQTGRSESIFYEYRIPCHIVFRGIFSAWSILFRSVGNTFRGGCKCIGNDRYLFEMAAAFCTCFYFK